MSKQYTIQELKDMDHSVLANLAFNLQDTARLWDLVMNGPTYCSYYTGRNGQGGALKERYYSKRRHHDSILEREAEKKGKRLGACSFVQFKAIGVPVNIYYGRDEESRLEYLENTNERGHRISKPLVDAAAHFCYDYGQALYEQGRMKGHATQFAKDREEGIE